jgi:hypothetical protein
MLVSVGEVRSVTCQEGANGVKSCSSNLSSASVLDADGRLTPRLGRFTPLE